MGIFNRDYYYQRVNPAWGRSPYDEPMRPMTGLTTVVLWLLWLNIGVYLAGNTLASAGVPFFVHPVVGHYELPSRFELVFGLLPNNLIGRFMVWQLVTYQFLHGSFMHIAFNMLTLVMFGPHIERRIGSRSFLRLYLIGGIFAGLINLLPNLFGSMPTVGASGSLCAIMAVFGLMNPNALMMFFILFFPVMVRARTFVIIYAVWTAIQALPGAGLTDGIAHLAHLGGLVFGWMYVYNIWRVRRLIDGRRSHDLFDAPADLRTPFRTLWRRMFKARQRRKTFHGQPFEDASFTDVHPPESSKTDWDSRIDGILDKMKREGSDSLTPDEWDILRRFRRGG